MVYVILVSLYFFNTRMEVQYGEIERIIRIKKIYSSREDYKDKEDGEFISVENYSMTDKCHQ
ncbi:MAG: hypothetical protein ACRDA4_03180 [Filifactoraceae bacterium]